MNGHATLNRMPCWSACAGLIAAVALALALPGGAASAATVGEWATYQWSSALTQEAAVLVKETGPTGEATWSVTREAVRPPPLFVTYSIVRGTANAYTMQITTHAAPEGPPLSITQVTVDRATGRALRSVIQHPRGVIGTLESGWRPFREADLQGTRESVAVPAGRLDALRAPYQDGTVWVSDEVPALGLVKAVFASGTLELMRSGSTGAQDLLRS